MKKSPPRVLLLIDDILIQEGLSILLQELHCVSQTLGNFKDWQNELITLKSPPQLIIAAKVLENDLSGEDLIGKLRAHFSKNIPAILLAYDDEFDEAKSPLDNIVVIAGTLEAKRLRRAISKIVDNEPSHLQH